MTADAEEIRDINSVLKLTSMLDYKKAYRKYEEGDTNMAHIPSWCLVGKSHSRDAYDMRKKTHLKSNDLPAMHTALSEFIDEMQAKFPPHGVLGFKSKMRTTKVNDGLGTLNISFYAHWFEFKSEEAIKRYIRQQTKTQINSAFLKWTRDNKLQYVRSDVLPTKLLESLLAQEIKWHPFCKELYASRLKKDQEKELF